jgi:hypothetical protein
MAIENDVAGCPNCENKSRDCSQATSRSRSWIKFARRLLTGFLIVLVGSSVLACLMPDIRLAIESMRRDRCRQNLKKIGQALDSYHEKWGTFPPAYTTDSNGKPMHSWRVLLLPYLGENELYEKYDFREPWDGPKNKLLLSRRPAVYTCRSHAGSSSNNATAYAAVSGDHCSFSGGQPVSLKDFTDGSSNTILVGEAALAEIPWTKPEDVDVTLHATIGDTLGFSGGHSHGVYALFGDGRVNFVIESILADTLRALVTRDAGDVPGYF